MEEDNNMSQEKVNRYKEEKANRKAIMRKERMKNMIRKILLLVLSVALIGWIGFSAFITWQENRPRDMVTVNDESITEYLQSLAEVAEDEINDEVLPEGDDQGDELSEDDNDLEEGEEIESEDIESEDIESEDDQDEEGSE
jgi:cytoskeletal protein RodZ